MRVAMFGLTGRAGGAIAAQCLQAGHEVYALARTPSRYDGGVTVTAGDVRDEAAVAQVVDGTDAVISAIGGTGRANPAVLEDGTAVVLAAMKRHEVSRLIVIQGFHLPFPGDPPGAGQPLMRAIMRAWKPPLSADTYRMAAVLRSCDRDWTLIRMPRLTAGRPPAITRSAYLRDAPMIAAAKPGPTHPQ